MLAQIKTGLQCLNNIKIAGKLLKFQTLISFFSLCILATSFTLAAESESGSELGFGIFQQRCMGCHGREGIEAPTPAELRSMSPERIYEAITTGAMQIHGADLSDADRRKVAESIAGRLIGSAERGLASNMPNQCTTNPAIPNPDSAPAWNGWGNDLSNTRFQPSEAAGINQDNVTELSLQWAFGFPDGSSAFGPPSVVSGRVFVGTDTGHVYSIDAQTGCVYWSYQPGSNVRTAITLGPIDFGGANYAVYFGDLQGRVYALNARTGEELWQVRADGHLSARITATPALHGGKLYVPVSSWEEFSARTLTYPCCTFRGSIVALDANNGEQLWKTYTVDEPQPIRINSAGTQFWAPSGVAVWNTPVVDPERNLIYFGTGDSFTFPAAPTSDAVIAISIDDGKIKWINQVHPDDSFLVGCSGNNRTENCPEIQGPDWDIPSAIILANDKLLVSTKPGDMLAIDPDQGNTIWRFDHSETKGQGMIWGGAVDNHSIYYGLTSGGLIKVDINTGDRHWYSPLNRSETNSVNHGSPVSLVPGLAFIGGNDGILNAVNTDNGDILWSFNTNQSFETVNEVPAKGGSIQSAGPVIANGQLFISSGYFVVQGLPGNVLLSFSID